MTLDEFEATEFKFRTFLVRFPKKGVHFLVHQDFKLVVEIVNPNWQNIGFKIIENVGNNIVPDFIEQGPNETLYLPSRYVAKQHSKFKSKVGIYRPLQKDFPEYFL